MPVQSRENVKLFWFRIKSELIQKTSGRRRSGIIIANFEQIL